MNKELNYLIYSTPEEDVSVSVVVRDDTIWLTQKAMAELFGCSTDNISLHLKNIFNEGELDKNSVTEKISATASDGKNYLTQFYNLDAIISVGYRVNSRKATNFRIWATGVLKEYMTKGFAMDDERLKQAKPYLAKTISESCWNVCALFVPANEEYGCKLPIFLPNVASTTIKTRR